jgi:hypothetical protein
VFIGIGLDGVVVGRRDLGQDLRKESDYGGLVGIGWDWGKDLDGGMDGIGIDFGICFGGVWDWGRDAIGFGFGCGLDGVEDWG